MFPGDCGTFNTVLQHELAHAIGFDEHAYTGQEGVSIQCVFSIQKEGENKDHVWSNFCQHEIEYIYAAYGQRQGNFDEENFWSKPIVTGLITDPGTIVVDQGASLSVDADFLQFRGTETPPATVVGTNLFWSVTPPTRANVEPSGGPNVVVTGSGQEFGPGFVNVTVVPPPLTYLRSTALFVEKHQIPLIVNEVACEPEDPVRVTAITADQEPAITTAGIHSFTATTICGQPTNFGWQFVPSSGGGGVIIFDGTNPQTYNVRAGDYTLTVTATPPSPGVALTRFVNVCTDGGMMLSVEDPGTDAVGGCGGGGELP
jgi:hypothetical protein